MNKSDSSTRAPRPAHAAAQPALDAVLREPAGDILRRAMWLEAVDRQLRSVLPVSLASHVRLANLAQGRLTLCVDNAIWHSRARLHGDAILQAARSIGLEVASIQLRVANNPPLAAPPPAAPASERSRAAVADALALLDHPGAAVFTPPARRRGAQDKAASD